MFNFFKHKQQKKPVKEDNKETVSKELFNRLQLKFCRFMSKHEQSLTNRQKKVFFWIFCSILGLYFSLSLFSVFSTDNSRSYQSPTQSITPPKDISLPDSLNIELLQQKALQKHRKSNSK